MAVTAKFIADFSNFTEAVNKAEVELKSFEEGANKVSASLSRMTNSLSGTDVIQKTTLMAEAVERVGGTSKLTEKELARIGATVSEAAAKMRAMGVDVPPGFQKIADEAKKVDAAHVDLLGSIKGVVAGFAAMFTARAAFNFVKQTLDEASALKDLSQQTHIGVEELQSLAGAMSEFGVDADTLGKGLFGLSRRIAKGDDSVEAALASMGIALKDVQGLNGEALFLTIERGLSKLQGGLRDTTATELFGSKLGMAMAGASEDIEGTLETWKKHNTVVGKDAVEAMDKYGEAIARAEKNLSSIAGNMIGPLAEGFNTLIDVATKGATKWQILTAVVQDYRASIALGHSVGGNLATLLDQLNRKTEENTQSTRTNTGAQNDHTAALGLTAKQWRDVSDAAMAQHEADKKYAKEVREMVERTTKEEKELYSDMRRFGAKMIREMTEDVQREMEAQRTSVQSAQLAIVGLMNDAAAKSRVDALGGRQSLDAQLEALAQQHQSNLMKIEQLGRQASELGGVAWLENTRKLAEQAEADFQSAWNAIVSGSAEAGSAGTSALNAIASSADAASTSVRGLAVTMAQTAEQMRAVDEANRKNSMNFGFGPNFGTADAINNLARENIRRSVPRFASGVSNFSGGAALVGEQGPELVTLPKGSNVIPNGALGGITLNVYVTGGTNPQGTGQAVGDAVVRSLKGKGFKV